MNVLAATRKILAGLGIVAFLVMSFPYRAQAQLVPFGGHIANVDYVTCSCGFVIIDVYDTAKQVEYRIIWFYLAQLLEDLGLELPGSDILPPPRIYAFGAIWPGSTANVVGTFFPVPGAMCFTISSTGCSPVEAGGAGYLVKMGTSAFGF